MISVVIPAYREEKNIACCLDSLRLQDYRGKFETIVVVRDFADPTAKIAKDFGAKVIVEERKGPAFARQTGFCHATGETLVALDADNWVEKNWLSTIDKEFKKDKSLVSVFGFIKPLEKRTIDRFLLFFYNLANFLIFYLLGQILLTGTGQAIKRKIFAEIGGFEPLSIPQTHCDIFDDSILFSRLKKAGKIKFLPSWTIWFSMRRFHRFGYFAMFWQGLRAWCGLRFFNRKILPNFSPVHLIEEEAGGTVNQLSFSLIIFILIFWAALGVVIFGPFLLLINYFVGQPLPVVAKRVVFVTAVILVFILPITVIWFSQTSWAQERVIPNLKDQLLALGLDEKLKNLTGSEVLKKVIPKK